MEHFRRGRVRRFLQKVSEGGAMWNQVTGHLMDEQGWPKQGWQFREMLQCMQTWILLTVQMDPQKNLKFTQYTKIKFLKRRKEKKKTQLKFGQNSVTFARIEVRGPADLAAVTPPFTTKPRCSALPDHHVQQGTWDLELRAMCWGSQETWTDTVMLGLLPGVSPDFTFAVGIRKGTKRKPQTLWKRTVFHSEEEGWTL